MARGGARRRAEARLLSDLEVALRRTPRALSPALVWRWRYEFLLVGSGVVGATAMVHMLGVVAIVLPLLFSAGAGLWPSGRAALAACAWWMITPHRIRAGCVQAGIYSRGGRLPIILRTSLHPAGERVLIWCTAGTAAEDFESAKTVLCAACWAADLRVEKSPRHAHLVTLKVIRHREEGSDDP